MNKIEKLLYDAERYQENLTLEDNIKSRLDKTLNLYLSELESASDRIKGKKIKTVYKELTK